MILVKQSGRYREIRFVFSFRRSKKNQSDDFCFLGGPMTFAGWQCKLGGGGVLRSARLAGEFVGPTAPKYAKARRQLQVVCITLESLMPAAQNM